MRYTSGGADLLVQGLSCHLVLWARDCIQREAFSCIQIVIVEQIHIISHLLFFLALLFSLFWIALLPTNNAHTPTNTPFHYPSQEPFYVLTNCLGKPLLITIILKTPPQMALMSFQRVHTQVQPNARAFFVMTTEEDCWMLFFSFSLLLS